MTKSPALKLFWINSKTMTVAELIKKLASYDLSAQVFVVDLSDDSGDSDELLTERGVSEEHGHVLITHSFTKLTEL